VRALRGFVLAAFALLSAGLSEAATPDRDKAWDKLIAEARKHGGAATEYKTSTSYVFQRKDGFFITLTELPETKTRAVCAMAKDQKVVVCGNWDSGALKYGWREDASAPWAYSDKPPEPKSPAANPLGSLLSSLADIMEMGSKFKAVRSP